MPDKPPSSVEKRQSFFRKKGRFFVKINTVCLKKHILPDICSGKVIYTITLQVLYFFVIPNFQPATSRVFCHAFF